MTAAFWSAAACPLSTAPPTSPCAFTTALAAVPTDAFALAAACDARSELWSITDSMLVENRPRSLCVAAVSADTCTSWSLNSAISSFAPPSEAFASCARPTAPWVASTRPAMDARPSAMVAFAFSNWVATPACDVSSSSFASASLPSTVSATTELTVDTNELLMVWSSVVAPVSVIFGETAPAFSFT
ncbi:hypothetical protein [Eggerthella sinensis]|uniref:hypothetical protein n=1 Tax=Eggerthella sinensis TaxID=242230 RepID=UPI0022DF019E|nr:hypothetical protein [Eggerthella sinensis]